MSDTITIDSSMIDSSMIDSSMIDSSMTAAPEVEVWCAYTGRWVRGFRLAGTTADGMSESFDGQVTCGIGGVVVHPVDGFGTGPPWNGPRRPTRSPARPRQ